MLITNLLRLSGDPCDRKRDAVSDRNVLVYQSLDNGSVYAIDVDRNVTHLVVDSNVVVRLYCIVCQFFNDIRLTDKRGVPARFPLQQHALFVQLSGHCLH